MINSISNQVSFRAISSNDLNRKLDLLQSNSISASSNKSVEKTETNSCKKNNNSGLKAVGLVAVLAGLSYLAKTGKLGGEAENIAEKAFDNASKVYAEKIKPTAIELLDKAQKLCSSIADKVKTKGEKAA